MSGAVEDGHPFLSVGDLFREHLERGAVAVGDQARSLFATEGRGEDLHVGELLGHDAAEPDFTVLPEEQSPQVADPHLGAGRLSPFGTLDPFGHEAGEHRPPRFAALLHRRIELLRRHVGMNEVLGGIINLVELELEPQHLRHAVLGIADRPGGLPPRLRDPGIVGGDEFIEDSVILLEESVEGVVVALPSEMDGSDEVDLDGRPAASGPGRGFSLPVMDDRRVERRRPPLGIAREPEELDLVDRGSLLLRDSPAARPGRLRGPRQGHAPPSPNHRDEQPSAPARGPEAKICGPRGMAPVLRDLEAGPHRSSP